MLVKILVKEKVVTYSTALYYVLPKKIWLNVIFIPLRCYSQIIMTVAESEGRWK